MARVVHLRLHGLDASDRDALHARLAELSARREWRVDKPWLADAQSPGLFEMEFFRHAVESEAADAPGTPPLCAAGFLRISRDETDALALLFAARDLSERFHARVVIRDPDNPIAKMRHLELVDGVLADGRQLESILVVRPIYKKLPGAVIEMYPPRALEFAFGTLEGADPERRAWSFLVHGMRGTAPDFLEAEAEAMRIYRGLRFLS